METLSELYELKLKRFVFLPRKKMPEGKRIVLRGVPKSGKTYHLLNLLNTLGSKAIYIDLMDPRIDIDLMAKNLEQFCIEHKITTLLIDNYTHQISLDLQIERILVVSNMDLAGFKTIDLFGLDFEEFIAFNRSSDDVQVLFNSFLKSGSIVELVNIGGFFRSKRTIEILKLLFVDSVEFEIYRYLLEKNGFILTPNQIYTNLKERIKISKDRLYRFFAELESRRLIFTIGKLDLITAPKKIYAFDHAIRSAVTLNKNFAKSFESMVALEVIKKGFECFYDDYIDLIIPSKNLAIIAQPFATVESIFIRSTIIRSHKNIKKIEFITMGLEYQKEENGVTIEAVPFWNWALR